uniref:Ubiquinol-cytochrome c chaperone n=1 Tax=Pfiesteria piscicida TaxID=71001 RepID=A3E3E0_PFIPI|nr:ubiquinol-cytochrome c chaperone [Pfiesteria piscicida]
MALSNSRLWRVAAANVLSSCSSSLEPMRRVGRRHIALLRTAVGSPLRLHGNRGFAAGSGSQFEKQLMPEDILHLRAQSMTIMQDPVCELRPEEAQRYVVEHRDPVAELPLWHPRRISTHVTQPFRSRKLAVSRYTDLIVDRLDNEPLLSAFGIDNGFNMQVYFTMLHAWLLHQRLVLEGSKAKKLDKELFESCWTLVRNFMWLKKIPEYRFDAELGNVQEYMLGCCVALDKALERPDILPARLQQELWANVYSGGVQKDAAALTRLTKYVLRQLGLMLQLDADHFLAGSFVWADFPVPDDPPKRLALPLWREEFAKVRKSL